MLNIRPKKTLESILSGFTKTRDELECFIASKREENTLIEEEIINKQIIMSGNNTDITKAEKVVTSIKSIIGE